MLDNIDTCIIPSFLHIDVPTIDAVVIAVEAFNRSDYQTSAGHDFFGSGLGHCFTQMHHPLISDDWMQYEEATPQTPQAPAAHE